MCGAEKDQSSLYTVYPGICCPDSNRFKVSNERTSLHLIVGTFNSLHLSCDLMAVIPFV